MPATRIDVARRAMVSVSTVSRVLNNSGYVSAEVRQRIEAAIKELNYVPNRAARSLRSQHYRQVACIGPSVSNLFYNDIVVGIEETALEYGYTLSWYHLTRERIKDIHAIMKGFYDGIIFLAPFDIEDLVDLADIARRTPTCLYSDRGKSYDIPYVFVDLRAAMRRNVEYLISLGHEHILFLGHEFHDPTENPRYQGYIDALQAHGFSLREELVQLIPNHKDTISYGHDLVRGLVEKGVFFSAIAASNDSVAVGALRGLREAELQVPEDVSVTGCDDIELANLITPALTTIHIPRQEVGVKLMELLLGQIHNEHTGGKHVELPTRMVIRESVSRNHRRQDRWR
ncbi:LacI family transcriptional regulator [Alicyclobacillus fastidiosus]|uniref:LacI family transcriptional regulator n=1 Tax=Alicyclobacillus fastidiosus TaxID=392011 RepID=A0ABY6ZIW5_9BACL|nr:LacI family DNA-binding transcriptional regulator [Alicyclobacillus fastidiosus]WAH42059.1 LacI family transcriptional regulator [Alicyclobacillus fastidiosus]GMA63822.1 LacI family transcriptional regulator [Alicyclobacillus fastidiosus]